MKAAKFHNRTRTSPSIPGRLLQENKWHLLPLYYLLRTSYLAREAITNSGSYLLADHIYRRKPSGQWGIGWLLDALLLFLPSARAFRLRYLFSRDELAAYAYGRIKHGHCLRIASIPCGIPRDLFEVCLRLRQEGIVTPDNLRLYAIDLDPQVLRHAQSIAKDLGIASYFRFQQGDALDSASYPKRLDAVVSTGLGEFLSDADVKKFYTTVCRSLTKGGIFITSAMDRHAFSDFLLRELAELHTIYRSQRDIAHLFRSVPFVQVHHAVDRSRLQTLVIAYKG